MDATNKFKRLQVDQIEKASRVAARAFQEDPIFVYYFPEDKKNNVVTHCKYLILLGMLSGEVYVTSNNIEGVAVWLTFRVEDQKIEKQPKEIIRMMRKVKRDNFSYRLFAEKFAVNAELAGLLRDQHANFPNWYLNMIAVDPIHQGNGYGGSLLRSKLEELDKQNLPCYLNTQNKNNLPLYEHFGFKLVGKARIPNTDFYYYGLLRDNKKIYSY